MQCFPIHASKDMSVLLQIAIITGFYYKLTPSKTTKFRFFQTEFSEVNFKFDENGRKFSEREQNTMGKGEIAHYEQILLCPQCFQKTCTADT